LRSRVDHAEAELVLSAIAKFLVHLLGEGEGLKWEMAEVGEQSDGEGRRMGRKIGMHEKIAPKRH